MIPQEDLEETERQEVRLRAREKRRNGGEEVLAAAAAKDEEEEEEEDDDGNGGGDMTVEEVFQSLDMDHYDSSDDEEDAKGEEEEEEDDDDVEGRGNTRRKAKILERMLGVSDAELGFGVEALSLNQDKEQGGDGDDDDEEEDESDEEALEVKADDLQVIALRTGTLDTHAVATSQYIYEGKKQHKKRTDGGFQVKV